jgi:hypothetical protein
MLAISLFGGLIIGALLAAAVLFIVKTVFEDE